MNVQLGFFHSKTGRRSGGAAAGYGEYPYPDCLNEPEFDLEGYNGCRSCRGFAQEETEAGANPGSLATGVGIGTAARSAGAHPATAVLIGVTTGTILWLTTKVLDRLFFK